MAGLEALLLFVVVTVASSASAAFAGWQTYAELKERAGADFPTNAMGRFIVFPAIVATPAVFGLVLWFLSGPLANRIDSGSGPTYDVASQVFVWVAIVFAFVAAVIVFSEAAVVRARMAQFVGADFGRVEPLIVVPEVGAIFATILAFLVIGRLSDLIENPIPVSQETVEGIVRAVEVFAVASLAMPAAVAFSNGVQNLRGPGFLRAILRLETGAFVLIAGFAWVFLQLGSLGA